MAASPYATPEQITRWAGKPEPQLSAYPNNLAYVVAHTGWQRANDPNMPPPGSQNSGGDFIGNTLSGIIDPVTGFAEKALGYAPQIGMAALMANGAGLFGSGGTAGAAPAATGAAETGGGLLGMSQTAPIMAAEYAAPAIATAGTSPLLAEAAQTLAQKGVTQEILQQASTNPTMMQQISTATGVPMSILSNANSIIPLVAGAATLLGNQAPTQPDVNGLINTQTAANKDMASWNTQLANPNQTGPGGSSVYDQSTNTFTQKLSPAEQALYEQRIGNRGQANTLAGESATRLGTTLAAPMPTDSAALRQQVIDAMMGRYKTDYGQREQQKISNLRAAGITPGTAAYDAEMRTLGNQYNDAYQQAQLAGGTEAQRAYNMDLGTRNQAMNETTGLFGLGNAENPNIPIAGMGFQSGATAQPVNALAANQNQYAQNVGQYNANMQGGYGLLGLGLQQIGK